MKGADYVITKPKLLLNIKNIEGNDKDCLKSLKLSWI